jgi:hypothetical protein
VCCGIQCHCSHVQEGLSWWGIPATVLAYTSAEDTISIMFVLIGASNSGSNPRYRLSTVPKLAPAECQQKSKAKRTKTFLERETLGAMRHCYPSLSWLFPFQVGVAGSSLSEPEKCWQQKIVDTTLGIQTRSLGELLKAIDFPKPEQF